MRDSFFEYHPIVNLIYFVLVLALAMTLTNPISQGISLLSAFSYGYYIMGWNALRLNLKSIFPIVILMALINPAFNHEGATIITYLPSGNPLTLESIAYGASTGVMLAAVLCWFSCFNKVMASDKFIYLFGRIIPSLSLILSMTLRFVPRFKDRLKEIINGQKYLGRDISKGGIIIRAKQGLTVLSMLVTWSLENSIETANSMKNRGYGLPGRSAFSVYTLQKRDMTALIFLTITGSYIFIGYIMGGLYWRYFPTIKGAQYNLYTISLYICSILLSFMPVFINIKEDRKWNALKSET